MSRNAGRQFGKVDLRGRKTLTVFVRNLSAISTPFAVKVRKYSCTPCPPRLKISNMSHSALQRVVSNPRALRAYLDDEEGGGGGGPDDGDRVGNGNDSGGGNPGGKQEEESGRNRGSRRPGKPQPVDAVQNSRAQMLSRTSSPSSLRLVLVNEGIAMSVSARDG